MKRLLIFVALAFLFLLWVTHEIADIDSKLERRDTGFAGSMNKEK